LVERHLDSVNIVRTVNVVNAGRSWSLCRYDIHDIHAFTFTVL
jgi:hypothetical protein